MEISEQLRCLFFATVEEQDDSYAVEIPEQDVQLGGHAAPREVNDA